jgi:hypothetical protein
MLAVIYLAISTIFGLVIKQLFGIKTKNLFETISPKGVHPPEWTFNIPFSIIVGATFLTTIHYFITLFFAVVVKGEQNPLVFSNILVFGLAAFFIIFFFKRIPFTSLYKDESDIEAAPAAKLKGSSYYSAVLWGFGLFAIFLIFYSFFVKGNILNSGYTVFSDFAPHTAVISSFAKGHNYPAEYPHFAGDGIKYHFFFFYLCGILNYLGMRIDLAMNIPSILGILSFTTLLGAFAVLITGKRKTFLIAPLLLFFRSSYAIFTYLDDIIKKRGADISGIISDVLKTNIFIGKTIHDDWGLWAMNVYANQRHLLWGFSAVLIILMLFYPTLIKIKKTVTDEVREESTEDNGELPVDTTLYQEEIQSAVHISSPGNEQTPRQSDEEMTDPIADNPAAEAFRNYLSNKDLWKLENKKTLILSALLLAVLPYWHGSMLITVLCVLFVMAFFAKERIAYIIMGATGVVASLFWTKILSGGASNVADPKILWGFISPDKSFTGVASYLFQVLGIALVLIVVVFIFERDRIKRILMISFFSPIVFAITVSLTPDVTVNHKYIIAGYALINIFIADLLCRLYSATKGKLSYVYKFVTYNQSRKFDMTQTDSVKSEAISPNSEFPSEAPATVKSEAIYENLGQESIESDAMDTRKVDLQVNGLEKTSDEASEFEKTNVEVIEEVNTGSQAIESANTASQTIESKKTALEMIEPVNITQIKNETEKTALGIGEPERPYMPFRDARHEPVSLKRGILIKSILASLALIIISIVLTFSLFSTGVVEMIGYINKNANSVTVDLKSPVTAWIEKNTRPEDVFLTAPYSMNQFFFTGRKAFYGWPYYPWSAGHSTDMRFVVVKELFTGYNGNRLLFMKTAKDNNIRFVIIDSDLISNKDYIVDRDFFEKNYEKVYTATDNSGMVIYKLYD